MCAYPQRKAASCASPEQTRRDELGKSELEHVWPTHWPTYTGVIMLTVSGVKVRNWNWSFPSTHYFRGDFDKGRIMRPATPSLALQTPRPLWAAKRTLRIHPRSIRAASARHPQMRASVQSKCSVESQPCRFLGASKQAKTDVLLGELVGA